MIRMALFFALFPATVGAALMPSEEAYYAADLWIILWLLAGFLWTRLLGAALPR